MAWLDGKEIAKTILVNTKEAAQELRSNGVNPRLAIVVASDDLQAAWYVRSIVKVGTRCEVEVAVVTLPADSSTEEIAAVVKEQASDDSVHGIILQTPLPAGVDYEALLECIPASKDVDGASPDSAGRLSFGLKCFAPATAEAVMVLLSQAEVVLAGKSSVVVGRSRIVGKPVSTLLLAQDATVTVCHSKSEGLSEITAKADVLVVAAGKAGLISKHHVKHGATVIDVGTNVQDGALVGDVAPEVAEIATLTPVPGGVGPVTTALILQHTVTAATIFTS